MKQHSRLSNFIFAAVVVIITLLAAWANAQDAKKPEIVLKPINIGLSAADTALMKTRLAEIDTALVHKLAEVKQLKAQKAAVAKFLAFERKYGKLLK